MTSDPRRGLGSLGERLAQTHLERAGYAVLERNHRSARGELDLVALGHGALVFCEVRTRLGTVARSPLAAGGQLESVGPGKRRRLRRMAREWLGSTSGTRAGARAASAQRMRFDVIGITVDARGTPLALEHVEDAF